MQYPQFQSLLFLRKTRRPLAATVKRLKQCLPLTAVGVRQCELTRTVCSGNVTRTWTFLS
ncbi:hypothetical protein FGSG_02647 [Fusarium graminearum PH-1]|uniref:hypothetical protein n=1 Tax=Gibberella zeae (strain ATCC MYA-4620 / CBS 123657 / FGSC 9075 / NRRL 31084 / PH-1) TaxID=229533 RepID=UPI00021F1901|nr:hypothetical protein FGSG_02647 [Fusarium graminearum PH-1]ESU08113.1 hypothetical protein FGSG_02647 [Fusarium graminearum PH-1]|eukprot:XP_011318598.1 hypothetical protein FGSG_02647 [Fusarium graminearum PH-1]